MHINFNLVFTMNKTHKFRSVSEAEIISKTRDAW